MILNSVKAPGSVSTSIIPECCLTMMSWLIERPRPVPSPAGLVVKNGLNIFSFTSGGIPVPLSRIPISTRSPRLLVTAAPACTVSLENQAEWILERPGINGTSAQLPNFGEIYFDSAMGGHGLDFLADAGTDTAINMAVNGTTVATTTVETPTLIKIAYTGS